MQPLDWIVLSGTLIFIVAYGIWKSRGSNDIQGYLLASRSMPWYAVGLSIMATQASAITFLSAPGLAYADGMRFVQFYFGLPIAMVVLCITAVPVYHRLNVYTAYEYLEGRFDRKTRTLAALLFLFGRGIAAGLTIYAPAIILSSILGWNIYLTNLIIGSIVLIYTVIGGSKAVGHTQLGQMTIILVGMALAFGMIVSLLPDELTFMDAVRVAGKTGRLNVIDFSFNPQDQYNLWSGLIGGFFLALSYFGTDQSQVGRYLSGSSIGQSRLGLLFNGMIKIPMQFFILFTGAILFVLYQFIQPPIFFNQSETNKLRQSRYAPQYAQLEQQHETVFKRKQQEVRELVAAMRQDDETRINQAQQQVNASQDHMQAIREQALQLIEQNDKSADPNDTNYIFLTFVTEYMPAGLVGLLIAVIFAASMSSTSSELNSLASTTIVDIYKRNFKPGASDAHCLRASKWFTLLWGVYAIAVAEYANRLGNLLEAVNRLGSLFYGAILGIFLVAFYLKSIRGGVTFYAALITEAIVLACFYFTEIAFLWYNVIGCFCVIGLSLLLNKFLPKAPPQPQAS